MKIKFVHGVVSLSLVTLAFILGISIVFLSDPIIGGVLAVILLLFFILVPKQVCRKCPSRDACGHVLMGKLSSRMSLYCAKAMGWIDLLILLVFMLFLVGLPQFWLYKYPVFLIIFWVLMLVGGGEIFMFVCPACGNTKCPLNKGLKRV